MRPSKPVTVEDNVLQNGILRARIDDKNGNVVELSVFQRPGNLVDLTGGQAVNQYLFLEGKDVSHVQTNGPVKITLEVAGPLIASLRDCEMPPPRPSSWLKPLEGVGALSPVLTTKCASD